MAGSPLENFQFGSQGRCHLIHVISPLIEIEQPGTKQTTRQQVAITQGLDQFREVVQPVDDLVGVEEPEPLTATPASQIRRIIGQTRR